MSKVFVPNEPSVDRLPKGVVPYNLKPAERFGEIVFVYGANDERPTNNVSDAVDKAKKVLYNITGDDYLLIAGGDWIGNNIVGAIFADFLGGVYQSLSWDKKTKLYIPIDIDLRWDDEDDES